MRRALPGLAQVPENDLVFQEKRKEEVGRRGWACLECFPRWGASAVWNHKPMACKLSLEHRFYNAGVFPDMPLITFISILNAFSIKEGHLYVYCC